MIGLGMRHSTPLANLFEVENEVNMVESNKSTASEWRVASVHVTNCKDDLNNPETTSQAIIIGSGKVMAAQFKGRKASILTDMSGVGGHLTNLQFQKNEFIKVIGSRLQSGQVDEHSPNDLAKWQKHNN